MTATLRSLLLICTLLLSLLVPPGGARATPIPPGELGGSADYYGFLNGRFLLLNMHGGLHHPDIESARENVRYAAWMHAGVIRIFATDSAFDSPADGEWMGNRIADLAPTLRDHNVKLIVALMNNHQEVPGERPESVGWKDGYWQHLLPFYMENWRGAYLDFSRRLIGTVVARGARDVIFAWEFGNEIHTQDYPPQVLRFIDEMAAEIKRIDPDTMLLPGTMGAQHLEPGVNHNMAIAHQLYCNAPIDAYTLHAYDWLSPDRPGDMPIHWDLNYVITRPCDNGRKLPVIVEELGTSRGLPGVWGENDEERRFQQEIAQIRMVLQYPQVVGIGAWSSESPTVGTRRYDNRRGLTSYGPGRDGSGSCYPPAGSAPGIRCSLENVLRSLPAVP